MRPRLLLPVLAVAALLGIVPEAHGHGGHGLCDHELAHLIDDAPALLVEGCDGRDLRKNLFHQVTDFSAREVGQFGAPSLITRITNDVQQVQMLVVMACTMAIAAPITMVVGVILAVRQ